MAAVQFWFDFASTYSYPAAMAIETRAAERGLTIAWRPFMLGPIFQAQGWTDSPFNIYPTKGTYMWRDMARICAAQGLELKHPTKFPRGGLAPARMALAAIEAGVGPNVIRAIYKANFGLDRDISDAQVIGQILAELTLPATVNAQDLIALSESPAIKQKLKDNTNEAIALGVFGAPSFTVGTELFWGQDRLEMALDWAEGAKAV
jgi:2-hydroxychromene-2-carboxylate isomerase